MDSNHETDDTGLDSKETQSTKSLRGKVILHGLQKRRCEGIRNSVSFNTLGQPYGPAAAEMQSYIGMLARTEVKITYKTWKQVPKNVKDAIWEHVNLAYEVIPSWRAGCLESANTKWRQWKSKLYKEFVQPHKDYPERLKDPPSNNILREDWTEFVISRMSEDFKKLSLEQTQRAKRNMYPHRLSRRGYAGLAENIKEELCGDADVDRAIMWKRARLMKNGDIGDENLKTAIDRIDHYLQKKEEGEFKSEALGEDLLTCALEKPEHSGRVRAIGSYVTPTMYFRLPPERRKGLTKDQAVELIEAQKQIGEQKEIISHLHDRLSRLEAAIQKDLNNEGNGLTIEGKGSCSVKKPSRLIDEDMHNDDEEDEVFVMQKTDAVQAYSYDVESAAKRRKSQEPGNKVRKVKCYSSLCPALKVLYLHTETLSKTETAITIQFDEEVFGTKFSAFLCLKDVIPFCDLQPISVNCIAVYMWHLYKKLMVNEESGRFCFVNPFSISQCQPDVSKRTSALAERLKCVSSDQLAIVPCNTWAHWILTVIDPHKETIYVLDPLFNYNHDKDWENIVNTAMPVLHLNNRKKKPSWVSIKNPRQPDSVQCGFFVMRFMKDIVQEFKQDGSISMQSFFKGKKYSQNEIDEVRAEWAGCALDYI